MPVPTTTFRNMKVLNAIFAVTAVVLLLSTFWLVVADHFKSTWRRYHRAARVWDEAILVDAHRAALSDEYIRQIKQLNAEIGELKASMNADEIRRLEQQLTDTKENKEKTALKLSVERGKVGPKRQQIERARLEYDDDSDQVIALRGELWRINEVVDKMSADMAGFDREIDETTARLHQAKQKLNQKQKKLGDLERDDKTIKETLAAVAPKGAAKVSERIRNAPLLDWFNASERIEQVVVPDVLTDYNFVQVETIDRCTTCHVNIDDPVFEQNTLTAFTERQVARAQGQAVAVLDRPVVMLGFWVEATRLAGLSDELDRLNQQALQQINAVRQEAGLEPVKATNQSQLLATFDRIAQSPAPAPVATARWYTPLVNYRDDLISLLAERLGQQQFNLLSDTYWYALIEKYNAQRKEQNLPAVSASPVLLGHPQIDLYAGPDSSHPVKTMGCTVCHEGSGQETQFEHTAHSPRPIWVDAQTGSPVADFMIEQPSDGDTIESYIHSAQLAASRSAHETASADQVPGGAAVIAASMTTATGDTGHEETDNGGPTYVHDDLNLADPDNPHHALSPEHDHATTAAYRNPADPAKPRLAIRQEQHWREQFGWHHIHYMHWEKPMHALEFVESSCNKCHTEVYGIRDAAPVLFHGRKLFAQLGCVNCHAVTSLEDDLDIKKVGPSLVNVRSKLSPQMTASWIWAPKAFRPTTRMPHYFMLENNSSPVDILRTRTEVTAITYYLQTTPPPEGTRPYEVEAVPELVGTIDESRQRGRTLFHELGCLACHSNLDETGEAWITADLMQRKGLSAPEAKARYVSMADDTPDNGYNARHWYVQQHLQDRMTLLGPELSGVGTKLKTSRTEQQARTWLYDWLRNPRHYSGYTIMPRFRLTEQDTNDLATYLLSLQRPGYEADRFGFADDGSVALDDDTERMLAALVANLLAGQSTPELARQEVTSATDPNDSSKKKWTRHKQLMFLGQKTINHYGCSGCHQINGFEDAISACTTLDEWGLKDPHKLDFGYFDRVFDDLRAKPQQVWRVRHEGLEADAPQIRYDSNRVYKATIAWEQLHEMERRPWAYHKLHNTRVYDRGRTMLQGKLVREGDQRRFDVGKPYDKLKMPKFFLTDNQVRALVTFITSIRTPLVSQRIQRAATGDAMHKIIRGRQLATLYNCYGCHNIEGNDVLIHQYFGVYNDDGSYNDNALNWAPPRLIGQGAKTQPDWLYHFLQNVNGQPNVPEPGQPPPVGEAKIRPWLKTRMPGFPLDNDQATVLVDYFASHSQLLAAELSEIVAVIDAHLAQIDRQRRDTEQQLKQLEQQVKQPGASEQQVERLTDRKQRLEHQRENLQTQRARWFASDNDEVQTAVQELRAFALQADLTRPRNLDPRQVRQKRLVREWAGVLSKARALAGAWQTDYPYVQKSRPVVDETAFVRGEQLFAEMGCMTGQCHRVGDEQVLTDAGFGSFGAPPADADDEYDPYGEDEQEPYGEEEDAYGEDDPYGAEDAYGEGPTAMTRVVAPAPDEPPPGAPNLSRVADRLQRNWVELWLQHPAAMQPGTRMQQYWLQGESHFKPMPQATRHEKEALYGHSAEQQQQYLMDFLYAVGPRRITYSPDGKRLTGRPSEPAALSALERPADGESAKAPDTEQPDLPQSADGGEEAEVIPVPDEPGEQPTTSTRADVTIER